MVKGLRIVFFGTPEFAAPTLDALLAASPHTVVGVVTQPDRPRGRGQKVSDAPVKARAVAAGLPILQPATMKGPGFLDSLAAWNADLGVVAAYGRILTDTILATPRLGMINVHASLLPRYRGAAPIQRAVIAGELSTGVTIMRVVKALDAGGMIAKENRAIGPDETSDEVERDLARIGARLLVAVVDQIARGNVQEQPQDEAEATYAHRLTKDDGVIDWRWPAPRIHNLIRGLHPWPHAFSFVHGKRVIIRRSETPGPKGPGLPTAETPGPKGPGLRTARETPGPAGPGLPADDETPGPKGPGLRTARETPGPKGPGLPTADETPGPKGPGLRTAHETPGPAGPGAHIANVGRVLLDPPGTILSADGDRLIVSTGDGALRILEIQAEGRRPVTAREYLAGHRLAAGDRFTPAP